MAEPSTVNDKPNAKNILAIGLMLIPAFSLLFASLHYSILFANFSGLQLNILTVGDYLDKAVEFIPSTVIFMFPMVALAFWLSPPQHQTESQQTYYKRVGGSKNIDKWGGMLMDTSLIVGVVIIIFFKPIYSILLNAVFIYILILPVIYRILLKHMPHKILKVIMTRPSIYSMLLLVIFIFNIISNAQSEANGIKHSEADSTVYLVDIIEAGYIRKNGHYLILEDKNWHEISKFKIEALDERNLACLLGVKYLCPKDKNSNL
jgi:hypothetical protein